MRRKSKRNTLKAIALSFAAAAVFTGAASGGPTSPDAVIAEVPSDYAADWLNTSGGVTPTNLARAYEPRFEGVARSDGYQPQLRGEEPLVIRDAPDGLVPQKPDVVAVSASSDGFDRDDVAIGFGLGLVLATACAMALAAASGRNRLAHS